jgi:hypothetical protein
VRDKAEDLANLFGNRGAGTGSGVVTGTTFGSRTSFTGASVGECGRFFQNECDER